MHALITGANGFVGSALLARLSLDGVSCTAALRRRQAQMAAALHQEEVGELGPDTSWTRALRGVDVVVHLAARVHVMHEAAADPLAEFRRVNVQGALQLARQAAAAGVRRFVCISSVKVNGERTSPGQRFGADDAPHPEDAYGVSKWEAESALRALGVATGLEVVIIRPPLVYGPGVKGNFATMLRWLRRGVPLPLGAVDNRRSLVALDNLVDLIRICMEHPAAAHQTFMVSDGEDLSTTALLQRLGRALGTPARLWSVPPVLLQGAAAMVGRRDLARRLCDSLQVDIGKTRQLLGWSPPMGVDRGLEKTVTAFVENAGI